MLRFTWILSFALSIAAQYNPLDKYIGFATEVIALTNSWDHASKKSKEMVSVDLRFLNRAPDELEKFKVASFDLEWKEELDRVRQLDEDLGHKRPLSMPYTWIAMTQLERHHLFNTAYFGARSSFAKLEMSDVRPV